MGKLYKKTGKWMGSGFELIVSARTQKQADHYIQVAIDEIERIELMLSEFLHLSDTSRINEQAGKKTGVNVAEETYQLIERCLKLSRLTQGAFDITAAPLKNLYKFKGDSFSLPATEVIEEVLMYVGSQHIELQDFNTVKLILPKMKISFASIGKGYAADRVRNLWMQDGLESGVVNASGDLCVLGKKSSAEEWQVGIADPMQRGKQLFYVPLSSGMAVATSGSAEQFFTYAGECYGHTIDPKSGMPIKENSSVSIFSKSGELSDALATAVSLMGKEAGLYLINQLEGVHAIIIDSTHKVYASNHIKHHVLPTIDA